MSSAARLTNYAAFVDPDTGLPRIGHLDLEQQTVLPLSFASGTPIPSLYQLIEAGPGVATAAGGDVRPLTSVTLLPPLSGRDVLAVGKNYSEHAAEFNRSGYDASDRVDMPSHPVIFTKRATSIVADGTPIESRPGFTQTLDYEGEIGVVLGRAGQDIAEKDAWDYVWGYTIINDVTAREKQRDHKQFFIGKSGDTYCPMGPIAVPKEDLPKTLKVETRVNGELRQSGTTDDLIFSIPVLIKTLSEGQTLQPGDVIATGTPAGVGFGQNPPVFLKPGDEVIISVTGLGALTNKVTEAPSAAQKTASSSPSFPATLSLTNATKSVNGTVGLTTINGKPLNYKHLGSDDPAAPAAVFVHGLGGTMDYWTPLIAALDLPARGWSLHLFDLEGHGLSPTHPLSTLSIGSFAADIRGVFDHAGLSSNPATRPATVLLAHSMGCLTALRFALDNPRLVSRLVLVGPPPAPLPEAAGKGSLARSALVRKTGMAGVVDAVVGAGTSERSKRENPLGIAAARLSLLGQDPEGYAKACAALAGAADPAVGTLPLEALPGAGVADVLIVTGSEDKVSPPALCETYAKRVGPTAKSIVLEGVGHWHVYEDLPGVAEAVKLAFQER